MSTWLPMSSPPLCIVWWKHGCPCMAVCLCSSHLISVPTPCLEYFHASVHEFMSTWLPMYAPSPMHSLMETWVPLHGSVFVFQSPHFCSHTLFRMCIWIVHALMSIWLPIWAWPPLHSYIENGCPCVAQCVCTNHSTSGTCTYVYLTPHICFTILAYLHGNMGSSVWHCECVAVIPHLD